MVVKITYGLSFLDIFSIGVLIPLLSKHMLNIGGTHLIHGTVGTIVALVSFLSGPIVGSLSDSRGRKSVLIGTFIINLISCVLLFSSSLVIYIISRLISGISSKSQVLFKALLSDNLPKEEQTAAYGKLGALGALGFIIGPVIGGYLYQKSNDFSYIAILLSVNTLICIGLSMILPEDKSTKEVEPKSNNIGQEIMGSFTKLAKVNWRVFWDIFLLKFLLELAFTQFYSTFIIVLTEVFKVTQLEIGYVLGLHGLLFIIANLSLPKINNILPKDDSKKIFTSFLVLSLTFVGFYLGSHVFLLIFLLVPVSYTKTIFDTTFLSTLTQRVTENEKGITMGSYDSIISLSGLSTPLLMGVINEYYGYDIARSVCMFTSIIATTISFLLIRKTNVKED